MRARGTSLVVKIQRVSGWRHLRAIVILPGMAAIGAPALILASSGDAGATPASVALGAVLAAAGIVLFAQTVALFVRIGRGTLAPWDPTARLVAEGPYRRVRNPMISGVLFVILGEAVAVRSLALLVFAACFLAVNAIWMPLVEEPGLRERFGADYERYAANVPRWLPRIRPWEG
jgi:protein-S-isoprenylcysteine O-methyltransferase Ste14